VFQSHFPDKTISSEPYRVSTPPGQTLVRKLASNGGPHLRISFGGRR